MKHIYIIIVTLIFASCTRDFESINTNPNAPTEVQTEFLLRQVLYNYGEEMSYEGFTAGNLLGQHFAETDFNLFDRHSLSEPQLGGNPWPVIYTNLRDNEIILDNARTREADRVYEGPALILKAYMTAALTDIYGDVPYSEALQGKSGIVEPVYDTQEAIYTAENGVLDNLRKGIQAIENYQGAITMTGDILYNGDLNAWIRFANSLRIKYLIRISSEVDVAIELGDIINEGNFITDNTQNASFAFTDGAPNNFRMATLRDGDFSMFVLSETMEEILNNYVDPRLEKFFRPTGADASIYNGLLNGQDLTQLTLSIGDYSLAGTIFRENTSAIQANFMTAWETQFLLAEAAHKGFFFSNPQIHYEEGVALAFQYWNTPLPADYLNGEAAYINGADNALELIITQKWIASIINGYEGWIEYRRTGFPELKTLSASLNNNLIPKRMPYPTDEEALNGTNFQEASTRTDGNSINSPVWWDQ